MSLFLIAVAVLEMNRNGIDLKIEADRAQVDPGRSVFLTLTLKTARGVEAELPDIRERCRGFAVAEEFPEDPVVGKDGSSVKVANWKLVPEPCAKAYKIAPFAVGGEVAGPVRFEPPAARAPVTGDYEADPAKMLPPLSWRLVGIASALLAAAAAAVAALVFLFRYAARRVREHRMSPIERAWAELDRLLKKGLPGRGRYKDFYVELTMVVRRYVQRKYGIRAPHLTTEEFLAECGRGERGDFAALGSMESLREFLESADMVKFAGVEATPEMADAATSSARGYLKTDAARSGEAAK